MARTLGLPLLLVSLLIGGYLFLQQNKTEGPTSPAITQAESQANAAVVGTNFQAADGTLQAWFAENQTYAGATLAPGSNVTLVRADATGYCLQSVGGTIVEHENGPGGSAEPGGC
jgi:hypothetical protein